MLSNILSENDFSSANKVLSQLPGIICIKNAKLQYVGATDHLGSICGFKDANHLAGHNDYELQCPAADCAVDFQKADQSVISSNRSISFLQIHTYANNELNILLVKKSPIKNAVGDIVGISCIANEISNPEVGRAIFKFSGLEKLKNKKMTNLNVVIDNTVHEKLSVKESELIFYFTRGFTSKDIGILMDLSSRTVESYLDSIKSKLHCDSRGELLMHCLSNGLSNIIPQSILQRCLNKIICL